MPARRMLPALVTGLTLGLTLAACGSSNDDPGQADPTPSASSASETTDSPAPSETPTPTESESAPSSESVTATPTAGPEAALLDATEMPQVNDTLAWKAGASGSISSQPFGVCQQFDLLTLGAERGVQRLFTADGASAGQQVVDFPDAKNALRGRRVLEAQHAKCARQIQGRRVRTGTLQAVSVSGGQGWWYVVSWVRGGQGHFESFGMALKGSRMSLVRVDHTGDDHDYPPGQDPGELGVKAAAQRLG